MASRKKATRTEVHEATAYREAGHAVVAWDRQIMLTPLSIFPNGRGVGRNVWNDALRNVDFDWVSAADSSSLTERLATVVLAGPVAETIFSAGTPRGEAHARLRSDAKTLLDGIGGGPETGEDRLGRIEGHLQQFFARGDIRRTVVALAGVLLERGRINGEEATAVVEDHMSRRDAKPVGEAVEELRAGP